MSTKELIRIREAVADYMRSEGCDCCRDSSAHREHAATLATLLNVPKYHDGSGFNFGAFVTKEKPKKKKDLHAWISQS